MDQINLLDLNKQVIGLKIHDFKSKMLIKMCVPFNFAKSLMLQGLFNSFFSIAKVKTRGQHIKKLR
jgi:hypothetical protein